MTEHASNLGRTNLTIREATPADAHALAVIEVTASQAAYRGMIEQTALDALDVDELTARWHVNIEAPKPRVRIMVCERGGQVVARCTYGPRRDGKQAGREGEIHGLYASPAVWGAGAGSALLADALCHLDRSFDTTVAWVLSQNPRARTCYSRAGFVTVADGVEHERHPEAPLCLLRRQAR